MKRLLKKLELTTPAEIYFDEERKKYSVEIGASSPNIVKVDGAAFAIDTAQTLEVSQ